MSEWVLFNIRVRKETKEAVKALKAKKDLSYDKILRELVIKEYYKDMKPKSKNLKEIENLIK